LKISIVSGKGGTGKTLVATSIAASLASPKKGRLTIVDCDVEEPNAYLFFQKWSLLKRKECHVPVPVIDEKTCTHCGKCADI
jgi:MinD superfamily P-loop ATPase